MEQLAEATIILVNVGDSLSPNDLEALYDNLDEGSLAELQTAIDGLESLVAALGDVTSSDIVAIDVTDEGEIVVYYA